MTYGAKNRNNTIPLLTYETNNKDSGQGDISQEIIQIREKFFGNISGGNISLLPTDKISEYIYSSFKGIVEENSINSYEEIFFYFHLLGIDKNYFSNRDIYDINNYIEVLGFYTKKIISIQKINSQNNKAVIESFLCFIRIINLICILNQNNSIKKDFLFLLLSHASQKTSDLIAFLEENGYENIQDISDLKYTLGLFSLNFSYIPYVELSQSLEVFLKDNINIFKKTLSGYSNCRKSSPTPEQNQRLRKVLEINSSYVISLLMLKTKDLEKEVLSSPIFQELLDIYKESILDNHPEKSFSLSSFKDIQESANYILIENSTFNFLNSFLSDAQDISDLIYRFTQLKIGTSLDNIEVLHHIILINDNIDTQTLKFVLDNLTTNESSNHINFEILRLKIFNIIISRLAGAKDESIKYYLKKISRYLDNRNSIAHILQSYSLTYLSIGYAYSFFDDEESHQLSIKNYSLANQLSFQNINSYRYGIDLNKYYYNIGDIITKKYGVNIGSNNQDSIINLGKGIIYDRIKDLEKNHNQEILNQLDMFLFEQKEKINLDMLSSILNNLLSNIFYGIVEVYIIDTHSKHTTDFSILHRQSFEIPIMNGYKMFLTYPINFSQEFNILYLKYINNNSLKNQIYSGIPEFISGIITRLKNILTNFNEKNEFALKVVNDFEDKLNKGQIELVFQGLHDKNGGVNKFEILTRVSNPLTDENGKKIFIRDYIDTINNLKRTDLLEQLFEYIVKNAQEIIQKNPKISLSINMEYGDTINENTLLLLENLAKNNFPTHQITLELIEGKWENSSLVQKSIIRLKKAGYKIAMDDFGSGESSVNRLLDLIENNLVDIVKIDGLIVKRLMFERDYGFRDKIFNIIGLRSPNKHKSDVEIIIKMIIALCKNHNTTVVAEYIENKDLFKKLKDMGVDYFQGYYFGKPEPQRKIFPEK